jgi:hypothetical protein
MALAADANLVEEKSVMSEENNIEQWKISEIANKNTMPAVSSREGQDSEYLSTL